MKRAAFEVIDLEVSASQSPSIAVEVATLDRIPWKTALTLVGAKNPDTGNEYRKWLDLLPGQTPDRAAFARFVLMYFFCDSGRGRYFSKARFLALESRPDELLSTIKELKIHDRIYAANLHQIGDFSRYGLFSC